MSVTVMGPFWTHPDLSDRLPLLTPTALTTVLGTPELLAHGLGYSLPLLFILGCHELGHWLACRRHGLRARPPLFLPAPVAIGTFGAFIRIREPVRTRPQLLDIGAAGPWAGLAALAPLLVLRMLSGAQAVPAPARPIDLAFSEPLLLRGARQLVGGDVWTTPVALPDPLLFALWTGLLITAFNLLPLGQLDGGHVLYAAVGPRQRRVGQILWLGLLAAGFWWPGWWVWAVLTLATGLRHPPTLDHHRPLDRTRRRIAVATLALLVLVWVPVPIAVL